jgi:hypothetical protein
MMDQKRVCWMMDQRRIGMMDMRKACDESTDEPWVLCAPARVDIWM